ncbi:hypothetical protein D0Z08_06860 [Nocardioides immobilis]|uniref:WD40 repeat domain-containing protein n=1 Tax=Nocardioides immobilis TaxID=2049295 RepID=A0A417Y5N8_9ACTN|nr:hypothetical protein [Nocardioides immobilis]RHW27993.1 hypothetical protein D0Z08_06860 [Nocardioides immobilis]
MTERLKQLLDHEADDLAVPAPATDAVLRQGRGLRRRNRMAVGAGAAAVAVIVGGSVVAFAGGDGDRTAPDPATLPVGNNAVFSYGNQVFYDGPTHRAEIQDNAVKSLYYTSAGVLVRHGDNAASDGGGPQRFSLVTPDGSVQRLGLETEGAVHASDVDQPYVTYGEAVDGELQVVVYDVVADAEEARVTVGPTTENFFPVSIDDDTVYVETMSADEVFEVSWSTGTVEPSDSASAWNVNNGRVATEVDGQPAVVDAASGEVLLTTDGSGYFNLSPDGRYAEHVDEEEESEAGSEVEMEVYDVASGEAVTFAGPSWEWGWTPGGGLFRVGKNEVETCDSATGECTTEPYAQPDIPDPEPVTMTYRDPICPDGGLECHTDPEFFENCNANPDQCEWREQTYVEESTNELRLGGVTYES